MKRLTIGVTVFNRRNTLERMIESLFASNLDMDGLEYTIRVYDDCSDEYTEEDVRAMFPIDIDYHRHDSNHGADYNMGYMFRDFIKNEDDILFNCDSDLIFDVNWLEALMGCLPKSDGVLSLFNTKEHKTVEIMDDICIKEDVGNAGTAMTRPVVEMICENISERESHVALDWNWCYHFKRQGKKIYSTRRSYVQHIGINGFNSACGVMDVGDGFVVNSTVNGQILGDVLCDVITQKNMNKTEARGFYYLFPYDRIPVGKKVVIYGAGVVGRDYKNQLEMCDYCDSLVQVDKNYKNHKGVESPEVLADIQCDYVVIAAHFGPIREEMHSDILKINPKLDDKIIDDVCHMVRL